MRVAIIGIGATKFGELWEKSYRDLLVEAGIAAIEDAGIEGKDIDKLYVGSMSPCFFSGQEHVSALIADYSGLSGVEAVRVEAACASGGFALREACLAIKSGAAKVVVACGVEKMTDVSSQLAAVGLMGAGDQEWEAFKGVTFPALYALMARRHMYEFNTTIEQISMVSVKNHRNALHNPHAQFRFEVTLDEVLESPIVADPLRLLHCSPITDGAAAVVLAAEDVAKKICETPVWIVGSAAATDTIALHDRQSITRLDSTIRAAKKAYEQARLKASDVDVAEVHDCFAIAEILAIEALGFCRIGEGGKFVEEGRADLNSEVSVNTSGGLKAKGHPVGATGIAQAVEVVLQLRGEAGKRQVDGAEVGITQNVGGSGATSVVHILRR